MSEITTAEAAAIIGVDQSRVRQLFLAGELAGRKLTDRLTLIARESAENYVRRKPGRLNESGTTGVYWLKNKNKWEALVRVGKKRHTVGRFTDKDKASEALNRKLQELGIVRHVCATKCAGQPKTPQFPSTPETKTDPDGIIVLSAPVT